MTQTPPELLAPYKAPLVAAARDLLRAAGTDGIAFEIPASVPRCVIVVGAEDQLGKLLRSDSREPMLGGRRAGDPPAPLLTFDEPESGDGPLVVDSLDLVTIRRWLQAAAEAGKPVTLSGAAAAALAAAEAPALDAAEMTRLRRLVHALGMDGSTNASDEQVRGLLFTALGQAAGKIERAAEATEGKED